MSGMCPVAGNSPGFIEFVQDDTPLGRPQIIEHDVGLAGSRRWNHPSLAKGSWPVHGNCVGNIPRPVTPSMEREIDRFFELAGAAYAEFNNDPPPRGVDGEFSAVMVRHIIGSLVGEHTMFKQRLPTQKDYVIVN